MINIEIGVRDWHRANNRPSLARYHTEGASYRISFTRTCLVICVKSHSSL